MAPILEVSDEVYQALCKLGTKHTLLPNQEAPKPTEIRFEPKLADYLMLERKEGAPLLVGKYRLSAEPAVKEAGKRIGLSLQDTAQERNGRNYAGNMNREQALKLNLLLGGKTANVGISRDYFRLLLSGKAFDGESKRARQSELSAILDEIIGVREPWRAEWFEDGFSGESKQLTLNRDYELKGGVLTPKYAEPLQPCLMEDRIPGISFKDWMKCASAQGFPLANVKSGDLYSWAPKANSVAGFYAYSAGADLDCSRLPVNSYPSLGVRHVREAHGASEK